MTRKSTPAFVNIRKRLGTEIQRLDFLRQNIYGLLAWLLVAALLVAILWSVVLSKISQDQEHVTVHAQKEAASLSKVYAQQLIRSLQQIDHIALQVKYDWENLSTPMDLEKRFQAGLYPNPSQLYVTIVDRRGERHASTLSGPKNGPNLADSDYFKTHKNDPSLGLLINEPSVGRRTGKRLVRFSRRLNGPDGSFDGVVIVSVEPDYFASFVDESSLNRNAFHTVRRSDGAFLGAKSGHGIRSLKGTLRSPPQFDAPSGVVHMSGDKFEHGQPRIIAWQKLTNYPVIGIVGISEEEVFAPHRAMERTYLQLAIAGSLYLLLATIVCMFFSARMAYRKRQAEEVKKAYRLATDGAREGFYIVSPLYDQSQKIVDFVVEDCNECGASYFGTTRKNFIGQSFSGFWPGAYTNEVIAGFRHAMETGFYEDEFRVPPESPLRVAWVHRRLMRSNDGLAVTLRDISDVKAHEETLSHLANADAVTTLPNRHWLMNYLPAAVERARCGNTILGLLFVDLDDFKNINDTLGHAAGDELLRNVAARLRAIIRPQDSVVRIGGDEFTVILEQVNSSDDVSRVADRIIKSFGETFDLTDSSRHRVHASIGISVFPQDGHTGEVLLKHADVAMYAAKESGKGQYQFYERQFSERLVTRLNHEQALRRAIEIDEFVLYYQPRVDTFTGELRSMEALVRWVDPERGVVSPVEFIPLAEETGLIVQLGALVIEKACAQLAQWRGENLPLVPVSINVSVRQFNHGELSALFESNMARYGIAPSQLEIEITESCMAGDDQKISVELEAIESLGVKLFVDDFGTGYSSMSQLRRFNMDGLKVDRSFTSELGNGIEGEAFYMAIVSMAHVLSMSVVAEGVETMEELRILQAISCNEVQGYLISEPVPADAMPSLMRKRFLLPAQQ